MDNESKSASAGHGGNTWLAVLVLAAGALVLRETALEGTRPAANEPKVEQRFAEQDIDARLWQDPLGAVARAREDLDKKLGKEQFKKDEERRSDKNLAAEIVKREKGGAAEIVVLAVMVPGGPYAEYVENRRRTRYAVLAGLNASGFVPFNTEHLGYFLPSENTPLPRELPETVPYEWFESAPDGRVIETAKRQVLVLWIDNDAFYGKPFAGF